MRLNLDHIAFRSSDMDHAIVRTVRLREERQVQPSLVMIDSQFVKLGQEGGKNTALMGSNRQKGASVTPSRWSKKVSVRTQAMDCRAHLDVVRQRSNPDSRLGTIARKSCLHALCCDDPFNASQTHKQSTNLEV